MQELANKQCILFINWKMSQHDDGNNNHTHSHHQQRQHHSHEKKSDASVQHMRNNQRRDSSSTEHRVLHCFCGCTELNFEQIEQYSMMSVSAMITHPVAMPLFRNFLRIGHRTDKSNALLSLECYEICDKIMNNVPSSNNDNDIDALIELCPSFYWEEKLNDAIESDKKIHDKHHLMQLLRELKRECVLSIESHNDYDRFRQELLRKIGKSS